MCNIYSSVEIISTNIQNEFVCICDTIVQNAIIEEVKRANYFTIIADTTPNSSHMEQTS